MNRKWHLLSLSLLFLASLHATIAADRPNILFILADDLGWSDLGAYGSDLFETPHLDRMAAQGVRFTQAYAAAPICSASRAAILTGKTPARLGFEFVTKNAPGIQPVDAPLRAPPFTLNLPLEERTIAEALREVGYQTGFVGKWHLNQHHQRYLGWSPTHGPKAQGFDEAKDTFGTHPYAYYRNPEERVFLDLGVGEYPNDEGVDWAIEFIKQPRKDPFFLMVSPYYVHDPIHTRIRWLHDHYLEHLPKSHPRRAILARYGAMVTTLDHYIGRLLKAVDAAGRSEDTIIVFTSDNGGHPNYAGNAPLRGSKWNLYEGGIRIPLIIKGLGLSGTVCESPVHAVDLYPTLTEIAGASNPELLDGRSFIDLLSTPTKPASRTLYWHFPYYHPESTFANAPASIEVDDGYTSQTRPHSAIRKGDWKLLHFYEDNRDELYNLATDLPESHDLRSSSPEIADDLRQELDIYLHQANARMPVKNENRGE